MLLRTKLHGKTYEFPETGGFDTWRETCTELVEVSPRHYSTTEITKGLGDSFLFPSFFLSELRALCG